MTRSSGFLLGLCLECMHTAETKTTYKASFLASLFPKVTEASRSLEDLFWESVGAPAHQLGVPAGLAPALFPGSL